MNIFNDKEFEENSDYEVIEYFILIIFLIIGSTLCFIQLLLGLAINGAVLFYLFAGQKKVKRIKKERRRGKRNKQGEPRCHRAAFPMPAPLFPFLKYGTGGVFMAEFSLFI